MRLLMLVSAMIAALGLPAPALATEFSWAHFRTTGEVGKRAVIVYQQDSIEEAINFAQPIFASKKDRYLLASIKIAVVFEDPAEPNMIATDYRINCRDSLYSPNATYTHWRDGAFTAESDDRFAPIVAGTPLAELMPVVCKLAAKGPSSRQRAWVKPFSRVFVPIDDVWANFLPGGTRPFAGAAKSEVQIAAEAAHNAREEAYRRESAIQAEKAREQLAQSAEEDRAFLDNLLAWKASKGDDGNPTMHSWIGNKASNLTASWGRPDEVRSWGAGQQLIYTSYASRGIVRGPVQIGLEEYYCHQSFYTERGYVVSWSTYGNNC